MITLDKLKDGMAAKIISVDGSGKFLSRMAAMGIVPGSVIEMVLSQKKYPFLIFVRDSIIAINCSDVEKINVEMVERGNDPKTA
ncbi:MAG: ferrous iron transport protein A [Puniceicoccales bacterium]|jgi:ferrous iron transport protein A|nr:ferrous iron transport protein A [Puniceicoccales bacterium]